MHFDPTTDHDERQLALIREQRPIVHALRATGLELDFLFAPFAQSLTEIQRQILREFMQTPLSLETRLLITDLLDECNLEQRQRSARARSPR